MHACSLFSKSVKLTWWEKISLGMLSVDRRDKLFHTVEFIHSLIIVHFIRERKRERKRNEMRWFEIWWGTRRITFNPSLYRTFLSLGLFTFPTESCVFFLIYRIWSFIGIWVSYVLVILLRIQLLGVHCSSHCLLLKFVYLKIINNI